MLTRKLAVAFGLAIALMIPLVASSSARVLIASESDLETIQAAVATAETGIENPTHGFAVSYLAKDWDTLSAKLSEGLNHGQMVSAFAKLNSQSAKDGDEETVNAKDDEKDKDKAKDDDEKDNVSVDSSDQEKGKSSQAKGHGNKTDDEDDTAEILAAVTATATPEATETPTTSTHGQGNANGAGKSRKP